VPRAPGIGRRQRLFFYFFRKSCAERTCKGCRQRRFLFFLKKFFAERLVQLRSAKLGTPELGKFFPELPSVIARSTRQRPLCRRPLSAKRPHDNTYISHPQVHTHHMCPQVHTHHKSTETSPQVHKFTKCLKSNETSSQHDQLSPRAYGECSCGGKGGTGDWRTCSPLGAW
jgi:hypothetical protein